jgi:hypothetical protein
LLKTLVAVKVSPKEMKMIKAFKLALNLSFIIFIFVTFSADPSEAVAAGPRDFKVIQKTVREGTEKRIQQDQLLLKCIAFGTNVPNEWKPVCAEAHKAEASG